MVSVSLCMIVKNEEDVLERCLKSVADLVDEIILVDTGSTDRTREIAAHFTDQVFDFPWQDDFSAARNESFSHASMDYCMWLDADDILLEADQKAFLALKETLEPTVSVVMAPYHTGFDESGHVTFSYYRERLIKNRAGMVSAGQSTRLSPQPERSNTRILPSPTARSTPPTQTETCAFTRPNWRRERSWTPGSNSIMAGSSTITAVGRRLWRSLSSF